MLDQLTLNDIIQRIIEIKFELIQNLFSLGISEWSN